MDSKKKLINSAWWGYKDTVQNLSQEWKKQSVRGQPIYGL